MFKKIRKNQKKGSKLIKFSFILSRKTNNTVTGFIMLQNLHFFYATTLEIKLFSFMIYRYVVCMYLLPFLSLADTFLLLY